MSHAKRTLIQHRQGLKNNQNCFTEDKNRVIKNWIKKASPWVNEQIKNKPPGYCKKPPVTSILTKMANMVWEAQGGKPLFQFDSADGLPLSWNGPSKHRHRPIHYWDYNYSLYEVGHMLPVNSGGSNNPENLCFQSARCNQHIQSSLPLQDVIDSYFKGNEEVLTRIESLRNLHNSQEWIELRNTLGY
jgi:hypothetical protein